MLGWPMRSPFCVLLALSLATAAGRASALSGYEKQARDDALSALGQTLDPSPEGKRIEGIDVVSVPVIDQHDPAPAWVNMLHATSKDEVLRREVLQAVGERYRPDLCDETARNLRKLAQLSLVLCMATRGTRNGTVRVLVVSKDVWSLRLGWDLTATAAGGLEYLRVEPSETNVAGTHQTVLARYVYYPASQGFGAAYQIPRLEGTRIATVLDATTFVNTASGRPEATAGRFSAGQPLYSTLATSGWASTTSFYVGQQRIYKNGEVKLSHGIPIEYRRRELVDSVSYTRSMGSQWKHDVTVGAETNVRSYRATNDVGASASAFDQFVRDSLPVSETRVGPFVQYRTYSTSYASLWNMETLGLEENFRLGPDLTVRVYPVTRALGSTHDFLGTDAIALVTAELGGGLLRAGVESIVEADEHEIHNGVLDGRLHIASPGLGVGRLVFDVEVLDRYENELNRISYLGGDDRLRGYATNAFSGRSFYAGNLELRTFPVAIWTLELAGAIFYDVGNALADFSSLQPKSAAGGGVRILFPQFNRAVFRIDVGLPLAQDAPVAAVATFEQAFGVPGTSAASSSFGPSTGWLGQ
jgi:outer membrane protein assembly factor BamA